MKIDGAVKMASSADQNPAAAAALERMLSHLWVKIDNGGRGNPPPIDPPIGADENEPMEARVANLEAFAADAKDRLTRVETKLDHIEKEVSNFKWWMLGGVLTIVITVITTVVATGVGIQQMTVTTFQAAGEARASGSAQPIVIQIPSAPPASPPR